MIDILCKTTDKLTETAIMRLQEFCPREGYYLAFSGGKDSMVIKALADMAGVKYDAHFNMTTVDPPEVLHFIREYYPDVAFERPETTMWQLIDKKGFPPTRLCRYCCEKLKETGGVGRFVVTGVRWEESIKRRGRQMVHSCIKNHNKTYLHPIIDWSSEDVWNFIYQHKLPYCSLYDEGFTRIGCVLCPMASTKQRRWEIIRFPGFYKAYMRCFEKMLEHRKELGFETSWQTPEEVMDWWINERPKPDENQLLFSMFE